MNELAMLLLGGFLGSLFAKTGHIPTDTDVVEALRSTKTSMSKKETIDVSQAHTNEVYDIVGYMLFVENPEASSVPVYVRFNEDDSEPIDITQNRKIAVPFYRFYVTNAIGTGTLNITISKNLSFMIAESIGKIDIIAQTIGNIDINIAAQVANVAIAIASADIMTPVDLQAQSIILQTDPTKWGGTVLTGRDISLDLAKLDLALTTLRDNLRGSSTKDFSTLEADIESILAILNKYQYSTPFDAGVDVTTSSTLLLPANSNRKYASFVNDSDKEIYLGIGAAAVLNEGTRLNPKGGSREITLFNLYTGAIYGIHGGTGNKRVTVHEGD